MANLIEMLQGQLTEGMIDQLSHQLGGADKQKTATAAEGALSTIIGALAKNASTPEGAAGLANALERDHDGGVLDGFMDMIAGRQAPKPELSRSLNGAGILKHILGEKQGGAADMLSQISGLASGDTGNLMAMLAPMVMGMLGKQKKENNLGVDGLSSLLNGTVQEQKQTKSSPMMDLATRFLDKDGDGSIMDEAAGFGMKILGGLFSRK